MKKILCLAIILSVLCAAPYTFGASSGKKKGSRAQTSTQGKAAATPKTEEKKVAAAEDAATADAKPAADKPNEKKADAKDAKKGDEKKADAKGDKKDDKKDAAGGLGNGFSFGDGGDLPFDLMRADSFAIDPDDITILTGKVRIESKDMNLSCDQVKLNNKTKMVLATGNPVIMDQPPAIQAKCRNLTYNMQTKAAVLENEAVIVQDKGGQKMQAKADTIKIDSDGSGKNQKVSLIMRPGSGQQPEIKALNKEDKGGGEKSKNGRTTTKINENNLGQISVPVLSAKSPGVE